MRYWTWCKGECFQSLTSSGSVHHCHHAALWGCRMNTWTHRNRQQATARGVWVWSVWVLLFVLPSIKVQIHSLILQERSALLCCRSWPNSPPSCLNFLKVRVTDMCRYSQLTFVFCLPYFCVTMFSFYSMSMPIFIIDPVTIHPCSVKSLFFTFCGFALCFVDT